MFVFLAPWFVFVAGLLVTVLLDHHPMRRTGPRTVELALLWVMVMTGIGGLVGAMGHLGPASIDVAESIGYAPSMFQWEVAFADIAFGALALLAIRFRDRWLAATVVGLSIFYLGDAVGHVIEMSSGNMQPGNVWALPNDIGIPLLAIVLLVAYRRGLGRLPALPRHGVVGPPGTEYVAPRAG
jgi:NO-binding membrane sensor protein with MHYT domain